MFAFPDHVAIRFVTEHRDVPPPNQIGNVPQILLSRYAARRIVRRIQKDRTGRRIVVQKFFDVRHLRTEFCLRLQGLQNGPRGAPLNVRQVRRKVRTENEATVAGTKKCFAKELFKHFGSRTDSNIFCRDRNRKLVLQKFRGRLSELRNPW